MKSAKAKKLTKPARSKTATAKRTKSKTAKSKTANSKTAKSKTAKSRTAKSKTGSVKAAKPASPKKRHLRAVPGAPRTQAPPSARHERSDDANAFFPDPGEGPARTRDDLAEALAEDFVATATSGNDTLEDDLERALPEELGGPFVVTRARDELAFDVDASNPPDATVEPVPRSNAGLVQRQRVERALSDEPLDEAAEEESD